MFRQWWGVNFSKMTAVTFLKLMQKRFLFLDVRRNPKGFIDVLNYKSWHAFGV